MNKTIIFILFFIPAFLFAACGEKSRVVMVSQNETPWLGVSVSDISNKMLRNLDLDNGVRVTKVYPESPAENAGIERDDILISFNGEKISDSKELVEFVQKSEIDKKVSIEFIREGQKKKTEVTIAERDKPLWAFKRPPRAMRIYMDHGSTWLGVRTENMTDQLRNYFGAPEGTGILIKEVIEDSPAEKAGLRAGDIIVRVERKEINDARDLVRAINYFDPNDEVEITFIRDKATKELTVKLGEKQRKHKFHRYGNHWDGNYYIPNIPEFEIVIPEIEVLPEDIEIDIEDIEMIEEKIGKEMEVKLEELDEKLHKLNEKLRQITINLKSRSV